MPTAYSPAIRDEGKDTMTESNELEAKRAALLAYIDKCDDWDVLDEVLARLLDGMTLAHLPESLRAMFEEMSVDGVTVLAMKPSEGRS
jgi:hypothetical protein